MDREALIDSIFRITKAERASSSNVRDDLREVREGLEASLGGTVRPSEAARFLRVTPAALKRWLDSGDISTVVTKRGRREISIPELIEIALEAEELRRGGRERVLSAVIRKRRENADQLVAEDLLPRRKPRTHREPELQSLAYHRVVAQRLTPHLVAEARRRIDRGEKSGRLDSRWATEWRRLLGRPIDEISRIIGSDSIRARELRQTSPFAGVLTEQERRRVLDLVEARR